MTGVLCGVLTVLQILECVAFFPAVPLVGSRTNEGWRAVGRRWWFGTTGAWHPVRKARSLAVRFQNGEVFDNVQLLGVDSRRDGAAIRIAASCLPVQPLADAGKVTSGDPLTLIANPAGLPWSVSNAVVSGGRAADELPGAGTGYRLMWFMAPASPGSSGGVPFDRKGEAVALVVAALPQGPPPQLRRASRRCHWLCRWRGSDAAPSKSFAKGRDLSLPGQKLVEWVAGPLIPNASQDAPDSMSIDAGRAQHFAGRLLQAELGRQKELR